MPSSLSAALYMAVYMILNKNKVAPQTAPPCCKEWCSLQIQHILEALPVGQFIILGTQTAGLSYLKRPQPLSLLVLPVNGLPLTVGRSTNQKLPRVFQPAIWQYPSHARDRSW